MSYAGSALKTYGKSLVNNTITRNVENGIGKAFADRMIRENAYTLQGAID
jgi:hypothetical protein